MLDRKFLDLVFCVLLVLLLLFAFVDVWYYARFFKQMSKIYIRKAIGTHRQYTIRSEDDLFKTHVCNGIVLPSDMDCMCHMNNSKYLREMDFGRVGALTEWGVRDAIKRCGGRTALSAVTIRYRRSLELFQRFSLRTRLLSWEEDALYLEQMFVTGDGFVCAVAMCKFVMRGVDVDTILKSLFKLGPANKLKRPPHLPEVQSWIDSMAQSSLRLRGKSSVTEVSDGAPKHHNE